MLWITLCKGSSLFLDCIRTLELPVIKQLIFRYLMVLNIPGLCSVLVCTFISRTKILYSLLKVVQQAADCSAVCFVPWNCFSLPCAVSASMSPALQQPLGEKPLQPSGAEESSSPSNTRLKFNDPNKFCRLCCASFNNPVIAQQHYNGKKHRRSEARKKLLEELGDKAVPAESNTSGKQNVSKCCNLWVYFGFSLLICARNYSDVCKEMIGFSCAREQVHFFLSIWSVSC